MSGYIRQRDANISPGLVIYAEDIKAELDAVQAAYNASTGHTHGGSAGEGAPIVFTGPSKEYLSGSLSFSPKTTNTYDLGTVSLKWKDAYLSGTTSLAALTVSGNAAVTGTLNVTGESTLARAVIADGTINSTAVGNLTPASGAFTSLSATSGTVGGSNIVTTSASQTLTNKTITSPTISNASLTGVPTAPTAAANTNTTQVASTAHVFAERTNTATLSNKTLSAPSIFSPVIFGGDIAGITDLAVADGGTGASTGSGAIANFGITASLTHLNRIEGITTAGSNFVKAANTAAQLTLLGFDQDTGNPGYLVLPGGMMFQRGSGSTTASGVIITFPMAFSATPTICTGTTSTAGARIITFQSASATEFFVQGWDSAGVQVNLGFNWMAFGI